MANKIFSLKGGNCSAYGMAITAFCFLSIFAGCRRHHDRVVIPSFYYWKTRYHTSQSEVEMLRANQVNQLYVRLFDLTISQNQIVPAGIFQAADSLPPNLYIIPVVFITNESLQLLESTQTQQLADKMAGLLKRIAGDNRLKLANEVQLDCDWTAGTRDKYFNLIATLKSMPFFKGKQISATIRLHQVKYRSQTGVPPVNRGMLMAYNMGNIRRPGKQNSILNTRDLKAYTGSLDKYPLPLDLALPLFNWFVWLRNDEYKGLIRTSDLRQFPAKYQTIQRDTMIKGKILLKGDVLRYEGISANLLQNSIGILQNKLKGDTIRIALYHLDAALLENWNYEQVKSIYNSFR